jgi:hypothetical protein
MHFSKQHSQGFFIATWSEQYQNILFSLEHQFAFLLISLFLNRCVGDKKGSWLAQRITNHTISKNETCVEKGIINYAK